MSCSSCNCNPCQCSCSCDPENEALSSAFATFSADFIGTIEKSCLNGEVVWTLPCDLDSDEPVTGIPKLTDESIFCYFLRVLQILAAETGITFPITIAQGGTNAITAAAARVNLGLEIDVDVQAWCANLDDWCVKDAPTGSVVGTTDSQTLTNKTVTNPDNTRQVLTDGATVNWDFSLGQCAILTIAGNRTMAAPTNLKVGTYIIEIVQTAGSNTLTWNALFKFTNNVAPTLSTAAGAKDVIAFYCNGTNLFANTAILNNV